MVVVVVRVGLVKQGYRRDVVSGGRHCWAHKICEGKRKVPSQCSPCGPLPARTNFKNSDIATTSLFPASI